MKTNEFLKTKSRVTRMFPSSRTRAVGVAGGAAQYGVAQNLVSSIGVSNILSGLGSFVSGGGNVGNAAQVAAGMMSV